MSLKNKVAEFFDSTSLDAFVAHSYVNVSYLSKANIFTQKLIPDRLALILWPRDSEPVLILCSIEEVAARRDSLISDIRTYVEHKESPIKILAETVRERKLGEKRIGFEEMFSSLLNSSHLSRDLSNPLYQSNQNDFGCQSNTRQLYEKLYCQYEIDLFLK